MTYKFVLSKPISNNIDVMPWFMRSYETIPDWEYRDVKDVDKDYEAKFNLKLVYGETTGNELAPIVAIEFPSEADATLFVLRWA